MRLIGWSTQIAERSCCGDAAVLIERGERKSVIDVLREMQRLQDMETPERLVK